MRKAILENGIRVGTENAQPVYADNVVTNVVVLPDDWSGAAGQWQPLPGASLIDAGTLGPGDIVEG